MNEFMNDNDNKKSFIGKIKESFSGRKFRSGAYVTLMSVIVIVIVLVANMIVSKLDLKVDMSSQKYYSLSDSTKQLTNNLKDDITIYYLVQSGNENAMIQKIAQKYETLSSHIKIVEKDPVLYPNFAAQYVDKNTKVNDNSIIVVNDKTNKAKYIDYSDMMVQEPNYQTYQYDVTGIDAEGKISSAIQYVTATKLPIMYVVGGHGETAVGTGFKAQMDKQNIEVKDIQTLTTSSIPKDCDILYINTPTSDYSENEVTMIKDYMAAGGKVLVTADYNSYGLKNFTSLINNYGIDLENGVIFEGDSNMYVPNYPHYLVPQILSHDITQSTINNKGAFISPVSSGLKILDSKRSSLTVEPLLQTSDKAYSKVNMKSNTTAKESGDIDGPFYVGLASTDTYKNINSKMVVFSSELAFDDNSLQYNADILVGAVNFLTGGDTSSLAIATKSVQEDSIQVTQQQAIFWAIMVIGILPLLILVTGFVVTYRRRRR